MPQGYVVAQLDELGQPSTFYTDSGFVDQSNDALFFSDKNRARSRYGSLVSGNPQNDYAVLPATLTITLA